MKEIRESPVVICIRCDDADLAIRCARAVLDGGLKIIEVTLTTPGALEIINELADDPRAVVGAGTMLRPEDVSRVVDAGGRFGLSPVSDPAVVPAAKEAGLFFVPGASTPSEIVQAHARGSEVVKVFPVGQLGGPGFIRAVRGPLPHIPLLPTNGVSLGNLPEFFEAGVFAVGVGREVLDPEAMKAGRFDVITENARRFADAIRR
jgi:2-dehydro-3-deoxyphosphogluconate aldolase/(4S)-4-hydroxy-2-oxoglutarate aldolase